MTIQWADDFKGYGTNPTFMADGLYLHAGCGLTEDPDPNATGSVVLFENFGDSLRRGLSGTRLTVGMAARYWFPDIHATSVIFARLEDVLQNSNCGLAVNSVGQLQAWSGSPAGGGTLLGQTAAPVIGANSWNHIEVKSFADATDPNPLGTVEIRVNGVVKLTVANVNTGAGWAQVEWAPNDIVHGNADLHFYLKDVVIWDTLGTENNNFLGTVQVIGRTPINDVLTGWTPASGVNQYAMIDNSPPLDGTEYLRAANPPPGPSSFGLSALPTDVTSVKALITQCRVRNTDGGDGNFQSVLVSGASTGSGTDRPMTSAFTYYEDVHELDPATAAAWSPAAADAAKLKITRTT